METRNRNVFVKYKDHWYLVDHDTQMCPRSMALFDAVVYVGRDGEYKVAKDRGFSVTPNSIPELQFELFLEGKTLNDLPRFSVDSNGQGMLKLYQTDGGDLVAMLPTYTMTNILLNEL